MQPCFYSSPPRNSSVSFSRKSQGNDPCRSVASPNATDGRKAAMLDKATSTLITSTIENCSDLRNCCQPFVNSNWQRRQPIAQCHQALGRVSTAIMENGHANRSHYSKTPQALARGLQPGRAVGQEPEHHGDGMESKTRSLSEYSQIAEPRGIEFSSVFASIPAMESSTLVGGFLGIEFSSESMIANTRTGS